MADSSNIPIHFAFPDGALRYDCAACDQRCCKLGGLVVFPAERDRILAMHPALELVSPAGGGTIEVFATPRSGCWFLDESHCRLLASDEPAMNRHHTPPRPAACTLFPFNLFGVVGDTLVVAPNAVCPLEVAPGRGVSHAELAAQLAALGAAGAPPGRLREHDPADSIVLERIIRDGCQAALEDPSPFGLLAFCDLTTEAFLSAGIAGLEQLDLSALSDRAAALGSSADGLAELLAIEPPDETTLARLAPTLAAWTPSIRIFGFPGVPLGALVRAQLTLTVYAAHWTQLAPHRPLVAQALMQLVSSLGPSIAMLSTADDALLDAVRGGGDSALARGAQLRRLTALATGGEEP